MEFIANIQNSRVRQGLTPENLSHLENVFRDTVGDKKEIDLNRFKTIVQSKNMFFVERIFRIFDTDNSGTVSLEEFLRAMWCFSRQAPTEKLRYLFEIYDLNEDGTIEFSELRSVISECMKENGLEFSEDEIDELTGMLFEDADTDGSGSITFNEFKAQLERHPAFLENLTLSIERWLLPPSTPPRRQTFFQRWRPRKLSWTYVRNNWTSVTFLLLFLAVNVSLFASRAVDYREYNGFVIVARACGQCLNFTCSFILVLVLRQTLTWLRTHGLAQYLPIDQHLYYHKLTGWFILIYSVLHTSMHIANFALKSEEENIPLHELLISTKLGIGWVAGAACLTGWILLTVLVVMVVSAQPFVRRSGKFEVFYCLHFLYLVFWICLILHGPSFWKWFLAPAVFFLVEITIRISRNLSSSKKAYVQQGVLLPSKVTHLVIKRPPKFDYRPGDYVYINIPSIARYEWHPFTISSAPELDDVIWLHIRGVGEWTNSLHHFFSRKDEEAVLSDELARDLEVSLSATASTDGNGRMTSSPHSAIKSNANQSSSGTSHLAIHMKTLLGRSCSEASAFRNPLHETFIVNTPKSDHSRFREGSETRVDVSIDTPSTPSALDGQKADSSNERSLSPLSVQHSLGVFHRRSSNRRTSFSSTSTSRAILRKNKEDIKNILAEQKVDDAELKSLPFFKEKRKSVRVSVAHKGLRRCQTVIVMPTVAEDDEEEDVIHVDLMRNEEEVKDLEREVEVENVVVTQQPLKIFLDGPYGSPTRHIFQSRHAVLIATGIGVTPFASILQSIMYQYRKSRHTCPSCSHRWTDPLPLSSMHLRKVDFIWLNRDQRSFEWFVNLLSELEIEQAQLQEQDRFLDIHMYITSALDRTDMKAVGLQMALDLLYEKEKRCLITGLKSRTQPGRPDWGKVFTSISNQKKGKVTVFFCGPNQLAKTLHMKCNEFSFRFRKEIF